jgi:hypothetical protein
MERGRGADLRRSGEPQGAGQPGTVYWRLVGHSLVDEERKGAWKGRGDGKRKE